jgi:hypothetical protein
MTKNIKKRKNILMNKIKYIKISPHELINVREQDQTFELCIAAVESELLVLMHIKYAIDGSLCEIMYTETCITSVKNNRFALRFVKYVINDKRFTQESYAKICMTAVKTDGIVLELVRYEVFAQDLYLEICMYCSYKKLHTTITTRKI